MQDKKAYLSAGSIICFTVLLNSAFRTCFHHETASRRGQVCLMSTLVLKHIFPVCKDGPAVIRTAMFFDNLWSQFPTKSRGVSLLSLSPREDKKPLPHCFLAKFFKVKPQIDILVVADKSLEFRWKCFRTEEHFAGQSLEMETNVRKAGT